MNICPSDCPNKFGGECDGSMCMPKQIEGNKKPPISERSITVTASTVAKQQADLSIKS